MSYGIALSIGRNLLIRRKIQIHVIRKNNVHGGFNRSINASALSTY